jgi:hypothetical protein
MSANVNLAADFKENKNVQRRPVVFCFATVCIVSVVSFLSFV